MQQQWIVVIAVAAGPFLVAAITWFGISLAHRAADRRRMLASLGQSIVVGMDRRRAARALSTVGLVVWALEVIVASMSILAAWLLGVAFLVASGLVVARGAFGPSFGVDDAAFESELRSFLDDAA